MKGFTCGAFDLLHPGHLYLLRECKRRCSYLVVGLHVDPSKERMGKNKPVQGVLDRYYQLMSTKYVDEVIPYETEKDLENILRIGFIDVRFVGSEYKGMKFTGYDIVPVEYIPRNHTYSSSDLRKKL